MLNITVSQWESDIEKMVVKEEIRIENKDDEANIMSYVEWTRIQRERHDYMDKKKDGDMG